MTTHRSFKPSQVSPNTVFMDADSFLGKMETRKIENNTHLQRRDSTTIAVMFWLTDVVTYNQDGTIILNSGRYQTVTTSARMNTYNPLGYVQKDHGVWMYHGSERYTSHHGLDRYYEYLDRMVIQPNGIPDTRRIEIAMLSDISGKRFESEPEAAEYVVGLELKQIKRLVRSRFLRHFAIEHCQREFVPAFLGNEELAETIERRLRV